jgi:hypothetical protein
MARALVRRELRSATRSTLCAILAACVLGSACDEATLVGPTLGQEFTLAPGESATVRGASLSLQFLRVSGDSRCPADAVCIQGGDAIVHVRAAGAVTADYELHTGGPPRAVVAPSGLRIELTQLQPYPFSSRTIQSGDYRATLVVTR